MGGWLQALSRLVHIKGRQAGPEGIAVVKSVFVPDFKGCSIRYSNERITDPRSVAFE